MVLRAGIRRPHSTAAIPTRFSEEEVVRIDRAASRMGAPSRSSFIRAAVLEKASEIEQSRVVEIRDVSERQAMRLIDGYLKRHPGVHYTSDLADALGIELGVAFAAAEKLIDKGRARVGRG